MHYRTSRCAIAVALALASSTFMFPAQAASGDATDATAGATKAAGDKAAAKPTKAVRPLKFKPTTGCEGLQGYDAKWASHGEDYGFELAGKKLPAKGRKNDPMANEPVRINGFYQMREHGGTLYAAFGGASAPGITPGALVMLDADTMAFKKAMPLPFAAHAIAVDKVGKSAVVTHTHQSAFSLVDLEKQTSTCRKPDTVIHGDTYRGRYVVVDDVGNFYINYNSFGAKEPTGYVMKYTPTGERAPDFVPQPTERSPLVIPLMYRMGSVLTGGRTVTAVNAQTGDITRLTPGFESLNVYNYVQGPGMTLLASNNDVAGRPNLLLIDPVSGARSTLLTGSGSVEVGYSAEGQQAFTTNYESNTVTVAALSPDLKAFVPGRFVNIAFEDAPANLHVRRTEKGTDVYVSTKTWEDGNAARGALLHRIHLDATVQGIDGIDKADACTVTTFDMRDKSVSAPVACKLMDAAASWKAQYRRIRDISLPAAEKSLKGAHAFKAKAEADMKAARRMAASNPGKAAREALAQAKENQGNATVWLRYVNKLNPELRSGLQFYRQISGE